MRYRKSKDENSKVCCCQSISCNDLFMTVREASTTSEERVGVIFHDIFTGNDQGFLKLLCEYNFKMNVNRNHRVCETIEEMLAIYKGKQIVSPVVPPATQYEAVVSPPVATSSPLLLKQGVKVQIENTKRDDMNGRQGVISQCLEIVDMLST